MTREVINNLPLEVRKVVESYRARCVSKKGENKREVKTEICGYAKGLRDAGLLTERERMAVVVYMFG